MDLVSFSMSMEKGELGAALREADGALIEDEAAVIVIARQLLIGR